MATLANPPKRWHIVLRCTICGPLGLLFFIVTNILIRLNCNQKAWQTNANHSNVATSIVFVKSTGKLCVSAFLGLLPLVIPSSGWNISSYNSSYKSWSYDAVKKLYWASKSALVVSLSWRLEVSNSILQTMYSLLWIFLENSGFLYRLRDS